MEIHVPPRLRAYVRERHGKADVAWADALPATVEHLSRRWSLEVIGAHPGSNRSLVVQASRREELVGLKIELCDTGQAGTLRALDGAAIGPGLLDVDPERGAMLMR